MLTDKLSYFKKRVVRKCYPFFVFSFSFFINPALAENTISSEIDEIRLIAKSGAVSLSLQSIDEKQNLIDKKNNLATWLEWERERIVIYQSGERWQKLHQRVAGYEDGLPDKFYLWAKQQQVDALLILKMGYQARHTLQNLIWSESEKKAQWLPLWQKQVIKSYLVDNDNADALLAAQRYYQDYQHNEIEDRLLRARILLVNQREEEVVELLSKDTKHPEGGMLYLLAQLRSNERPPRKVLQSAYRQMRGKWASQKLKFMLWAVVAESAKRSKDLPSMANALEFVLAGNKKTELPRGLFDFSADVLWQAYIDYALHIGNQSQFLIGNDQPWFNAAIKAQKKEPVKARSLFAMVMLKGQSAETRSRAAKGFLNLMRKRKRGAQLVMKLFLDSENFKTKISIPAVIRYELVKIALSRSNIELASNLMLTIHAVPAGVNDFQWQLRRARIFVLGGKHVEGAQVLSELLKNYNDFTKKQIEQFLQVVFDLQTAKSDELAYTLFKGILSKIKDPHSQREIYYWMADSKKALQDYVTAARLYLRSAMHGESKGLDPWGQTARYQVAEMLAKADLLKDARVMYQGLLKTTKEPARRAVLKHELQKLWLLRELEVDKEKLTE